MKIKYLLPYNSTEGAVEAINPATQDSIVAILAEGDELTLVKYGDVSEEEAINTEVAKTDDSFNYVCIVNNGSTVRDHMRTTFLEYCGIALIDCVYLPIVELNNLEEGKASFRGFLNSSLWKPYFAENIGELDLKLSKRGLDLVHYGALIPLSIMKKYPFKTDIKYYSYFEFFNRIIHNEVPVIGVPRLTFKCVKDYELKSIPKEEKLIEFKKVTAAYTV